MIPLALRIRGLGVRGTQPEEGAWYLSKDGAEGFRSHHRGCELTDRALPELSSPDRGRKLVLPRVGLGRGIENLKVNFHGTAVRSGNIRCDFTNYVAHGINLLVAQHAHRSPQRRLIRHRVESAVARAQ